MFDILLAAAAVFTPQASATWQVIDINSELKRVLSVDVASKPANPKPDAVIKARVFVTLNDPNISALTGFWSIDCGKNMHRVSDTITIDKAGVASEPDPDALAWEANVAGTLFASVTDYVCRGTTKYSGKTFQGAQPIAAANAFL